MSPVIDLLYNAAAVIGFAVFVSQEVIVPLRKARRELHYRRPMRVDQSGRPDLSGGERGPLVSRRGEQRASAEVELRLRSVVFGTSPVPGNHGGEKDHREIKPALAPEGNRREPSRHTVRAQTF